MDSQNPGSERRILLWGGKSKARVINEMIIESKLGTVILVFDSKLSKPDFTTKLSFTNDVSVLKKSLFELTHFVVCMGGSNGFARSKISEGLERMHLESFRIDHTHSFIDPTSVVGRGSQIMPGVTVHKFVKIGNFCVLNTNCSIDHETEIGDGVHIMGSAAIAGQVTIENFVTIGTNATIFPKIVIGEGSIIGAGSVVTKDVPPYSIFIGSPAKFIRKCEHQYSQDDLYTLENI